MKRGEKGRKMNGCTQHCIHRVGRLVTMKKKFWVWLQLIVNDKNGRFDWIKTRRQLSLLLSILFEWSAEPRHAPREMFEPAIYGEVEGKRVVDRYFSYSPVVSARNFFVVLLFQSGHLVLLRLSLPLPYWKTILYVTLLSLIGRVTYRVTQH